MSLSFYATVTSCKNSEKFYSLSFDKPSFGTILCTFWPKNFHTRKSYCSQFQAFMLLHLCSWISIFHKMWQTSFWAHFGLFSPKNLKTRFFPKTSHLIEFYCTKNKRNSTHWFFIGLEKSRFGPFWPQKTKNKIY